MPIKAQNNCIFWNFWGGYGPSGPPGYAYGVNQSRCM